MEAQDILSLIGFEATEGEEPNIDKVRDYIGTQFVTVKDLPNRKDLIEPILKGAIGQRIGSLQTKLVSSAKELGIDVNHADFKDKQIEDLIPSVFGGIAEKMNATKQPDDKLSKEVERLNKEYGDLKGLYTAKDNEITELQSNFAAKESNWKIDHSVNEAWKTINYLPTVNALSKKGFESTIKENYDSQVDADGNVWPVYKSGSQEGSRVKNPVKMTEDLNWSNLLTMEAKKAELLAEAHSGKPARTAGTERRQERPEPQAGARKVHPAFAGR